MRSLFRVVLAVLAGVAVGVPAVTGSAGAAATTTVVNGDSHGATIRFDTHGDAIDAHDGEIQRFGNSYYFYGTSYGCGYVRLQQPTTPFCGFRSYSSPDLRHWTPRGFLFDASGTQWQSRCSSGTLSCYRPHVVHNARTGRYVLWMNSYDVDVGYHVFTSSSPVGPFQEAALPRLARPHGGDMDLFVDGDGSAYLAYTDRADSYNLVVERLDSSYTTGIGRWSSLGLRSVEAPSMFKRAGTYYVSFGNPGCAYCASTGAAYVTARSPLGPYHGNAAAEVAPVDGRLYSQGVSGLTKAGSGWVDYVAAFRTVPQLAPGGYAQAGWYFRARDVSNGYLWLLGNYPYPGATEGSLTKVVLASGRVVKRAVVPLPFRLVAGREYAVQTRVLGSRITTWVNGVVVDDSTDTTYGSGRIGVREYGGESAYFDDVTVRSIAGTLAFADSFNLGLGQWDFALLRRPGFSFSTTSCGGQPADVAALPSSSGTTYLFQSDRWNFASQNQALALHYWEPLSFGSNGSISPLRCQESYALPIAPLGSGRDLSPANLDATTGSTGFRATCDVAGATVRAQSFTVSRGGTLTRVGLTAFQTGHANTPLTIDVTTVDGAGHPATRLFTTTASPVSWSPGRLDVFPRLRVKAGQRLAVVARAPALTTGCYGVTASLDDPYKGGGALFSSNAGATWLAQAAHDLRFDTSVKP